MRYLPTSLPCGCGEGLVDCGLQISDFGLGEKENFVYLRLHTYG